MGRVHLVVLVHGLYGSPSNLDTVAEELRAASAPASAAAPTSTSAPESTYASASKPPSISISTPAPSSTSTPISISAYTSTHPSTSGSSSGTTSALPSTASLSPSTSSPAWPSQNPTTSSTFSTSTANAHVDARGDEEKPTTPSNDGRGNEEKLTRTPSAPRATREPEPDALETVVYLAKGFRGSHTWDGIDVNAWRAAAEVDTELERLEDEGNEVVAFSVMGYSLGGLIARYLVGILHARQPSFFARHRPASFSTAATPHLGVLKYRSTLNTVVHTVGRRLFSRTGRQLYALDREVGGRSLLDVLADPSHIFVQALQLFPRIMIVANGCNDLTVPYPTAAISPTDPFEAHALTGVKVVVSTDHIVQSWVLPRDKANGAPDHVKDLEDLKVFQPAQATPTVPDAPSLPCPASTSVVEGDQGVVTTSSPPTASTAATVSRTRPRVPPILFLPYPFPFRYALFLLLPIIVPLWMLFVSIVFTLHTWQSRRRIWTHHSVHEVRPLLDEEDLSAPLRISHSRLIQLRSDHSTPASSTASTPPLSSPPLNHTDTDDPTSLHHPKQIPLLLTSRQKDMIHNLTTALPQLERLIAWFPYVYNSHGTIIVRDGKRFKAREEGRGIVRAWTRWVVDSARQRGVGDVGSDGVVDVG